MASLALLLALATVATADRTFTIVNNCAYSVWPAVAGTFANSGYSDARGWEATSGSSKTVTVPEDMNMRVWPRRGCTFDANGAGSCIAGNCAAGRDCADATMGWANLFELNMNQYNGDDYWDISAVPGFVTPMSVVPSVSSCSSVTCSTDLNPTCPDDLRVYDSDGTAIIACLSACMTAMNAGSDTTNSNNCCSGSFNTAATCSKDGVDDYTFFKDGCENAYAYPFDDQSTLPTVVWTCPASSSPDYTITFCPDLITTTSKVNVVDADAVEDSEDFSSSSNELLGMSRPLAISLIVLMIVLVLALVAVCFSLGKTHRQIKDAEAHEEEAKMALVASSQRKGYRDEEVSEAELGRKRSRRSSRA
ncbi:hypothetical protein JCM8547_001044 [Rhodosporidiobolus lusitaniae]